MAEYDALRPKLRVPPGGEVQSGASKGEMTVPQAVGVEFTADEISIGGDVIGRDKTVSFGGHFIVAREGAQVFIGQPAAA